MRFGKNVLSQNLRTDCDLALYLTLFVEKELKRHGMPAPLEARPGVGELRDAGFEQEALIFDRLAQGLGSQLIGQPPVGESNRWGDQPLEPRLLRGYNPPFALVQPKFEINDVRDAVLSRLGVTPADLALMPSFEGFIPDLALVEEPTPGMYEMASTGERLAIEPGDMRLSISVIDVKHAQQANPSYEAEVVLYGVMLANWLAERGLATRYFVNARMYLWTRGGVAQASLQQVLDRGERDPARIIAAARAELGPVNVPIYVQAIRRFFAERLPDIVRRGAEGWRDLEWYVGPACASCDWLGFEGWLSPRDREKVAANPDHYCFPRARMIDHLSRLPLSTRGACRVMRSEGYETVAAVATTTGDEQVYTRHTLLQAERRSLPALANAITTAMPTTDPERPDGILARYADLDVFLSVNFDPGAGLLTAIGLHAYFLQPVPYEQRATAERRRRQWREKWIVADKSPDAEEGAILGFLQFLASIFECIADTAPERGGAHAEDTRTQIVFWDRRQFEELCLAIGRHLPAILYDRQQERLIKALAWVFPPEELQELDNIDERRPGVAFVRDVVRRLVRVPAVHALTLFNVVEHYHHRDEPFRAPDQFYREPLSDTIPRERIYEIWHLAANGGRGIIRWGGVVKTLSQLTESFGRAVDQQGWALAAIAWRLRRDFASRLKAEAPKMHPTVPTWTRGVAHDAKLWIAWAKFETAFGKASKHNLFLADADEAEANYEGLRLTRLIDVREDGTWVFDISPASLNSKVRAPNEFLCLSVNAVPGFPALTARAVLAPARLPADIPSWLGQTQMHKLFPVALESLDRARHTAVVRLGRLWGQHAADLDRLRRHLMGHLGDAVFNDVSLVPGLGMDVRVRRLERILGAVGDPPNARPAPEARAALGTVRRATRPGTDPVTPISRVLWDAPSLHAMQVRTAPFAEAIAARARAETGLNSSQTAAVREAAARGLTVIWGPPGTGKTKTCQGLLHSLVVEEAVRKRDGGPYAILVSGPTYKAVGEIIGRLSTALAADARAACRLWLIHSRYRDERFPTPGTPGAHLEIVETIAAPDEAGFQRLAESLASGTGVNIVAAVAHQCPKIVEALARLDGGSNALRELFDFVLIDESSQVDMITAVGPLALLKPQAQLVVAGDHLQMPPVFLSDPPLGAEHLVGSLQTYLIKRFQILRTPLLENYRSNGDIVGYTRRLGYPPNLVAVNPKTRIRLLRSADAYAADLMMAGLAGSELWSAVIAPARPIVAVTYPDGMAGQANGFEADCVASLAFLLRSAGSRALDGRDDQPEHGDWDNESFWSRGLGVVTPHRAQRAQVIQALLRAFPDVNPDWIDGAVDTVERFQGGERHTIIISFGVGDPDVIRGEERFLMQLERTNVAISRAMGKCIVLMSDEVANHIPEDRRAAETAHALRGIVDEWCTAREPGTVVAEGRVRPITVRWRA